MNYSLVLLHTSKVKGNNLQQERDVETSEEN